MKSIKENVINEIIINKSRFITVLEYTNTKENVLKKLEKYKNLYKGATHYCFAYILENTEKASDDGEPSGTAGIPMLNVLKNHNLTNVLCIVIRYFGGIKLGAGGLVRAYSKSVSEAIKKTYVADLVDGFFIKIEFNYDNIKQIDYLLSNLNISKTFDSNVVYSFKITADNYKKIENSLKQNAEILKKEKILIAI